jgi:mannose-6-phosphate isomerase-like protein (cupin superfamily)
MTTESRPWGRYTILDTKDDCQVKRIEVEPGKRLSLQSHQFRAEHWFIVAGTATAQVGESISQVTIGQAIDVLTGVKHRIANTSESLLVFIEVQTGSSFDEDDIVRYDDDFGRA